MNKLLYFSTRAGWFWVLTLTAISAFFAQQLPDLKIDTTTNRLMSEQDPDRLLYYQMQEEFGADEILTVVFDDPDLFTPEKLTLIRDRLHELQILPEVYKLESLFNTNNFFNNSDDILETIPIFDQIPDSTEEILRRIDIARNNPLFFNTLVSAERSSLTLHLYSNTKRLSDPAFAETFVKKVEAWLDPIADQFAETYIIGAPMLNKVIKETMLKDLMVNFPISLIVIALLLFFIVGTSSACTIPLLTGCLSVLWALGTLALLDIPLQLLFTAIPVILVVIGSTEDTHIISGYLDGIEKHSRKDLAIELMSHRLSAPILLTTLTTAIGFATIMINEVITLKEFGLITSISLVYNFFITITLVPILLKFMGESKRPEKKESNVSKKMINKAVDLTMLIATRYRVQALVGLSLVTLTCLYSAKNLKADNDPLNSLKESSELKKNLRKLNRYFTGNDTFFITLSSKDPSQPSDFRKFEQLQMIEEIEKLVREQGDFDTTRSLASLLSLINRELNQEEVGQFRVPTNNALLSQYMLFLSVDDKEKYVSSDFSLGNIVVWYQLSSSEAKLKAVRKLEETINNYLADTPLKAELTGRSILVANAAETIILSQVESLALLIFCVFVIIALTFWDLRLAFLSLIPNTIPIIFLFGVLGFIGIPLDFVTCNIAAISIGVAVDDTIHFLSKFNQAMKTHHDQYLALEETLKIEMRPILSTSFALAFGLFTLALSDFVTIIEFGVLTGLVLIIALVADLVLTPLFLITLGIKSANSWFDRITVRIGQRLRFDCLAFRDLSIDEIRRLILRGKVVELPTGQRYEMPDEESFLILLEGEACLKKVSQRERDRDEQRTITLARLRPAASLPPMQGFMIEASTPAKILLITAPYLRELALLDGELAERLDQNLESIKAQAF